MRIDYVQTELPDSAPLWLLYVEERTHPHSIYVASGHYTYDEASRFLRRYFVNDATRDRLFIDVGANIGAYTLAVASLGVPSVAIEPLPDNFLLLTAGMEKNGLRNVRCLHAAITDQMSVLQLGGASAWGHVSEQPGIAVPGLTLDHLLSTMELPEAAFIKIDVEGHEHQVLMGAQRFLDTVSDVDIMIEIFPGHEVSLAFLEQRGFHCYMIKLESLIASTSGAFQEAQVTDYFCTRRVIRSSAFAGTPIVQRSLETSTALLAMEASDPALGHRIRIASRLREAPSALRESTPVREILKKLAEDPDEQVRAALSAWYPVGR